MGKGLNKSKALAIGIGVIAFMAAGVGIFTVVGHINRENSLDTVTLSGPMTEEDLREHVSGIEDKYAVQGAENVNLLADVSWDEELIKDVTVDDSNVRYAAIGVYDATYTVTYGTTEGDVAQEFAQSVTVVSVEDAQRLASVNRRVMASDGKIVAIAQNQPAVEAQPSGGAESTEEGEAQDAGADQAAQGNGNIASSGTQGNVTSSVQVAQNQVASTAPQQTIQSQVLAPQQTVTAQVPTQQQTTVSNTATNTSSQQQTTSASTAVGTQQQNAYNGTTVSAYNTTGTQQVQQQDTNAAQVGYAQQQQQIAYGYPYYYYPQVTTTTIQNGQVSQVGTMANGTVVYNNGTSTASGTNQTSGHSHSWEPVTRSIYVEEGEGNGHYEDVIVAYQCSICGMQQ